MTGIVRNRHPGPAITIAMTTGANLRRARATVMMMHGRLNVVLATLAKNQIKTRETATPILAGPTEIATMEKAIATTPCAAQNPGRTTSPEPASDPPADRPFSGAAEASATILSLCPNDPYREKRPDQRPRRVMRAHRAHGRRRPKRGT
jgi:hypothetical protein